MRRRVLALPLLVAAVLAAAPSVASAELLTYTAAFNADGSLGGFAFTDATVTLLGIGDTDNIVMVSPTSFRLDLDSLSLIVTPAAGDPLIATFAGDYFVSAGSNAGEGQISFVRRNANPPPVNSQLAFLRSPDLLGYDLATPISPVTSGELFVSSQAFATTAGDLVVAQASDPSFGAVPEPSGLVLVGLGLVLCGAVRFRRAARVAG